MGFRFRRSVKLLPGVRLNFGKKGSSLSIGGRGATVNIGQKGVRTTVGLPGTGMSYSTYQPYASKTSATPARSQQQRAPQQRQLAAPGAIAPPPLARSPAGPSKPWPTSVKLIMLGLGWAVTLTGVTNGATWLLWTACPVLGFATWRFVMAP